MSTETLSDQPGAVFWQEHPEDGVGEPAILIRRYSDVLELQQGKSSVLINNERVSEFLKAVKTVQLMPEPK